MTAVHTYTLKNKHMKEIGEDEQTKEVLGSLSREQEIAS